MTAKKIIVGYDRSADAKAAAAWALDEAEHTGARVEFFYAYEWPTWMPATSTVPAPSVWPDGETDRAIHGMLNEAVTTARLTHPRIRTDISIVHASAALTLIHRSAEASLVAVGSQGHSGVTSLLGSVSVAVGAHARCPVVVVRGDAAPTGPVVVGLDDSTSSVPALAFAYEQAAQRGADLRIIRAWDGTLDSEFEHRPTVTEAAITAESRRLDDVVSAWRARYPDVKASAELVRAHPAAALTRASADARLVVVGSRGRGPVRGMLLGSVSQHLLHHSTCSVAVVRELPAA
jgi:nucleotide-binding universal stress UspA family protein